MTTCRMHHNSARTMLVLAGRVHGFFLLTILCVLHTAQPIEAQAEQSSITLVDPPPASGAAGGSSLDDPITFGPDTRVNSLSSTQHRPQVEPSVANDPTPGNWNRLVASFADYRDDLDPLLTGPMPGVALSNDRGRSWSAPLGFPFGTGAILPPPPGYEWGSGDIEGPLYLAGGDNSVAWGEVVGGSNTVYIALIGFQRRNVPSTRQDCTQGGVYVYRSDNGGSYWDIPKLDGGEVASNTNTVFHDKPYITVDTNVSGQSPTHKGNVYLSWTKFSYFPCPSTSENAPIEVLFSRSTDDGVTWSAPLTIVSGNVTFSQPAVAPNGNVFVTWDKDRNSIYIRKSTNGGQTFTALGESPNYYKVVNIGAHGGSPTPVSLFRAPTIPSVATDPYNSQRVYVTFGGSLGEDGGLDTLLSWSNDGGVTWPAEPIRVNDNLPDPSCVQPESESHYPPNPCRDSFFPWISVAPSGMVQVMWADERLGTDGRYYDIFMAQSRGFPTPSFGKNFRLTTLASNPQWDGFPLGGFIGDYFGLSSSGVAVWDDERAQGINQDIYGSPRCHLDVDVDYTNQPLTDGLLCYRFLNGYTGTALTDDVIGAGAKRPAANEIVAYLDGCKDNYKVGAVSDSMLDVDGNGSNQASKDGLLILRWLFGFTGSTLTQNAVGAGCTRCTAAQIEAFLALFNYLPS